MLRTFHQLWALLSPRERKQALLLLVLMLVLGIVELVGVASIFPLIAVLSNPDLIYQNQYLLLVYESLGFSGHNSFFVFLSATVFAIIVVRTGLTAVTSYGTLRYAQMRSHSLSVKLLGSYLRRPYAWFLNRHSADMGKSVLSEVEQVINGSLMPAMQLFSRGLVAIFLVSLVVAVDPFVASAALLGTALAYGAVYVVIRHYLLKKGQERIAANRQRYKIAQEVLAGVKEVKIGGLEAGYLKRFDKASLHFGRVRAQLQLMREVPRNVLELIAIGGILTVIMALLIRAGGDLGAALPVIALYAFAGLRLLPAVQVIYQSVVSIRFGKPALDALWADLLDAEENDDLSSQPVLPLSRQIELDRVTFSYPGSGRVALDDISLTIPARTTVGFVGTSGAGKSTIIDVILGLLEPQQGQVKVDGASITRENVRGWQRSVGYVPQQIFLADESVAANIAFGIAPGKIDRSAVEQAARAAKLHDFIVSELPNGYDTMVGDRGIRLSGGQRQRLGIARSLYGNPDVLVLDEATSALDTSTEEAVMDAVDNLLHVKTIIIIAHRLTTVKNCDTIYRMERGRIIRAESPALGEE